MKSKVYYTVRMVRSKRATEREGYEYPHIEKHIADFETIEEAKECYNEQRTGMEVDKELIKVTEGEMSDYDEVIESTYDH